MICLIITQGGLRICRLFLPFSLIWQQKLFNYQLQFAVYQGLSGSVKILLRRILVGFQSTVEDDERPFPQMFLLIIDTSGLEAHTGNPGLFFNPLFVFFVAFVDTNGKRQNFSVSPGKHFGSTANTTGYLA